MSKVLNLSQNNNTLSGLMGYSYAVTHCASCSPGLPTTCPSVAALQNQFALLLSRMEAILAQQPVQQVNITYHISGGQFVAGNNTGSIIHAEGSQVMGHGNSACVQADQSNVNIVGSNSSNNVSNQVM